MFLGDCFFCFLVFGVEDNAVTIQELLVRSWLLEFLDFVTSTME